MTIKENHTNNIIFNFKYVKPDYVYKTLCKLMNNTATGYDNLLPKKGKDVC